MENNQWFSKTREILNKLYDLKGIDGNQYGDVRAVFIYHITIQYKADIDDVVTKLFEELNKKLTSEELKVIKKEPQGFMAIKTEFLRWVYADKKVLKGLENRRNIEFEMYKKS